MPERILVYNLFEYYYLTRDKFYEKINGLIEEDINNKIEELIEKIKNSNDNLQFSFSNSFIRFVERVTTSEYKKTPDYFLLNCYEALNGSTLVNKAKNNSTDKGNTKDENIKTLKQFSEYVEKLASDTAGALSIRELNRLLTPKGKPYTRNQINFIGYLMKRVFPTVIEKHMLHQICNNWIKITFYSGVPLSQKIYIQNNDDYIENVEEYLDEKFKAISKAINTDNEKIGQLLWEVFTYVQHQYRNNKLGFCQDNTNTIIDKKSKMKEDYIYNYDAKLSTHVIWFMRWLPLIPENFESKDLLSLVSNLIDVMRRSLFDDYNKEIAIEGLNRCANENLFIYEKDQSYSHKVREFRVLLLKTLYDDPSVKDMVEKYYKTI